MKYCLQMTHSKGEPYHYIINEVEDLKQVEGIGTFTGPKKYKYFDSKGQVRFVKEFDVFDTPEAAQAKIDERRERKLSFGEPNPNKVVRKRTATVGIKICGKDAKIVECKKNELDYLRQLESILGNDFHICVITPSDYANGAK